MSEVGASAGLAARTLRQTRPKASRYLEISGVVLMVATAIVLVVVILNLFPPASDIDLHNDAVP